MKAKNRLTRPLSALGSATQGKTCPTRLSTGAKRWVADIDSDADGLDARLEHGLASPGAVRLSAICQSSAGKSSHRLGAQCASKRSTVADVASVWSRNCTVAGFIGVPVTA